MHAEDTRYVLLGPESTFVQVVDLVRKKFGMVRDFKVKMADEEGDMITMADEDDWEMCVAGCRKKAVEEESELGKIDVSTLPCEDYGDGSSKLTLSQIWIQEL